MNYTEAATQITFALLQRIHGEGTLRGMNPEEARNYAVETYKEVYAAVSEAGGGITVG